RPDDTTTSATEGDEMVAELGTVVGDDPGDGAVLFVDDVVNQPEDYLSAPVRIAGTVSEVCQNAGCWLTFQNEAGVAFRVNVPRDENGYVFTFPMDISGSHVLVAGELSIEETDVETLRHFAQDRGESEEAIAAITEPERTLVITATGARIESTV
ncbi:MAG: DUF4920 domain-containing protein, partial [Rubricoccaceae bacterium]|nr:DUF4920 domain-containing protein [Rubricoccaceae bacterium]